MFEGIAALSEIVAGMEVVDLSPLLERGIPRWPTHPHLVIDPTVVHEHDGYYCQSISMAEHTGAHVDAPAHVHADRMDQTIDTVPADVLVGAATVYHFAERGLRPGDVLTAQDFQAYERAHGVGVGAGEIALIDFGWMDRYWRTDREAWFYAQNEPGLDDSAAAYLASRGVKAVGSDTIACDTPVVDGVSSPAPGHALHWLPNGILIVESLANLSRLPARCYFMATPLKIRSGSGSPVRPIAFVERPASAA